MKYLLVIALCFASTSLMADLNKENIKLYLQEKIDKSSYEFTHTNNPEKKIYQHGYMDALYEILSLITKDQKK